MNAEWLLIIVGCTVTLLVGYGYLWYMGMVPS